MRPFREAVDQGRRRERHGSSLWAYGAVRLIELISFALEILHDSPGTLGLALSGAVVTVIAGASGNTWGPYDMTGDIDQDKVDQAVLALLLLGRHEGDRTWKAFDWDAMNRLHRKGYITDPVGKAKSVLFTEAGLRESERLFGVLFRREQRE